MLLFVAAVGTLLSFTVFFRIQNIDVTGSSRYAEGSIVEASGVRPGDNLFRVDRQKAAQAIVERFPYIESAALRLQPPSGLLIQVETAVPEAVLEYTGGYLLVSRAGRVLESGLQTLPEGYTRVVGVDVGEPQPGQTLHSEAGDKLEALRALNAAIESAGMEHIDLIDLTDELNMRILYQNRLAIELGSEGDLEYKMKFAQTTIAQKVDARFAGILDVSTRPMARLRQLDIHDPAVWPFPAYTLADYGGPSLQPNVDAQQGASDSAEGNTA
jgi:hypothetical protein